MAINKLTLLQSVNVRAEAAELLGQPKNGKYRCFRSEAHKHGDASPSLSMNDDGYWACHSCAVKGDLFQLYMDVKGIPNERFGEVIGYFARKYNIDMSTEIPVNRGKSKATSIKKRKILGTRKVVQQMQTPMRDLFSPKYGAAALDWLQESYGITPETAKQFGLGWSDQAKRIFIPIPVSNLWKTPGKEFDDIVNIRKHDILRYHCNWKHYNEDGSQIIDATGTHESSQQRPAEVDRIRGEWVLGNWLPKWDGQGGKVYGVSGHNSIYLYPMASLQKEGEIWIVAGEFKTLLLLQHGINAICFTSGEANYSKDLCELFHSREVKVLYDVDEAGQKGAVRIGQALADAGAIVKVGQIPPEGLPPGGDITDYMRKCKWDISCLQNITWTGLTPAHKIEPLEEPEKKIIYKGVPFNALTDGEYLNKYIEVAAIVSGKGITPYAVPYSVAARCPAGEANQMPKCATCSIAKIGFMTPDYPKPLKFNGEKVVDMTGLPKKDMGRAIREAIGINPKCNQAKYKTKYATVDRIIIVPTVDANSTEDTYRHQQVYLITDGKKGPRENEGYILSGKLIGDPKNHAFTMAAMKTRAIEGDVFSYEFSNEAHAQLKEVLWTDCNSSQDVMKRLIADLRDNVLFKYGVDTMLTVELLSWFMPFTFNIGKEYKCHKTCPEVLIIGDTRVGKSTTAQDLSRHLGAGRYVDCGSNPTFVGLVGGNTEIGQTRVFTWGVIPTTNRGHLTMDEANKLSLLVWGGLTNLKSSGVASRQTNSGDRKTVSNVRFLTLCNPRGARSLGAYDTPLDAAIEVVGTPQDLARIDLLYVARSLRDTQVFNVFHETKTPHNYTKDVARYHLKWTWNLKPNKINFVSPIHVLSRSDEIIEDTKGLALIAPTEAKYKIGRIAVAIACIAYSYDHKTGGVLVTNEHVDMAYGILKSLYTSYMKNAGIKTGVIPKTIKEIFDAVSNPKLLRILATSDTWMQTDFTEIFRADAGKFKYEAQLEHGLMTRRRNYFQPVEGFQDIIRDYVNMRLEK